VSVLRLSAHEDVMIVTCYVSASASGNSANCRECLVIVRFDGIMVTQCTQSPMNAKSVLRLLIHLNIKVIELAEARSSRDHELAVITYAKALAQSYRLANFLTSRPLSCPQLSRSSHLPTTAFSFRPSGSIACAAKK